MEWCKLHILIANIYIAIGIAIAILSEGNLLFLLLFGAGFMWLVISIISFIIEGVK